MIFCNAELAEALGVTVLLQFQLSKYIGLQLPAGPSDRHKIIFKTEDPLQLIGPICLGTPSSNLFTFSPPWPTSNHNVNLYWVNPPLLELLDNPRFTCGHKILSFPAVYNLFLCYLLERKSQFEVPNNDRVHLIQGDPLERAFGMRAFGKNQINLILKRQLLMFQGETQNPFLSSPYSLFPCKKVPNNSSA